MEESLENCGNCRFWKISSKWVTPGSAYYKEEWGKCLLRPVAVEINTGRVESYGRNVGVFAEMVAAQWCGEWQVKSPKTEALIYADYLEEKGEVNAAQKLRNFDR